MQRFRRGNQTGDEDTLTADSQGDTESPERPSVDRFDVVLIAVAFLVLVAMILIAATA